MTITEKVDRYVNGNTSTPNFSPLQGETQNNLTVSN